MTPRNEQFITDLGDDLAILTNAMAEKYPLGCDFGRYQKQIERLAKSSEILHAIATDKTLKVVRVDDVIDESKVLDFICECVGSTKDYSKGKRSGVEFSRNQLKYAPDALEDLIGGSDD